MNNEYFVNNALFRLSKMPMFQKGLNVHVIVLFLTVTLAGNVQI